MAEKTRRRRQEIEIVQEGRFYQVALINSEGQPQTIFVYLSGKTGYWSDTFFGMFSDPSSRNRKKVSDTPWLEAALQAALRGESSARVVDVLGHEITRSGEEAPDEDEANLAHSEQEISPA